MTYHHPERGFTLLEVLLVMAVVGALAIVAVNLTTQKAAEMRRDRAASQIQQILSAELAFYVNNSTWSNTSGILTTLDASEPLIQQGYLGQAPTSPWGTSYMVASIPNNNNNNLEVYLSLPNSNEAAAVAGRVTNSTVVGSSLSVYINAPGQNPSVGAFNFSGVYLSGGCVPVPTCPRGMIPQILVSPASAGGVNNTPSCSDNNNPATCTSVNVYPLNSIVAYATGPASVPPSCNSGSSAQATCSSLNGTFWRVCLNVISALGVVNPSTTAWNALSGTLFVITRCMPSGEPTGSATSVYVQ